MGVSFSHVPHAVYCAYLLKLTGRLTLQFVSVSPFKVRLGQTCSLSQKVWWGHKTFFGDQDFCFLRSFNKKFCWQNKIWRSQKNLGELAPKAPRGYRFDSDFLDTLLNRHYLTKQIVQINEV